MANQKLVHIAHLLQDLTQHFNHANHLLSRAWLQHEMMRDKLRHLTFAYQQQAREEKQKSFSREALRREQAGPALPPLPLIGTEPLT